METLKSKWQAISFGGKLFMLSPIAVLMSYKILDDTVSVRYFLLIYGSLGIVVYLVLKFLFRKNKSMKFDLWGYAGSFLLFASFSAFLNYGMLKSDMKIQLVTIEEKSESSLKSGSKSCYIFFMKNKKSQRFTVDRSFWNSINKGEQVKMHYQEGVLGFDVVKEFKK